MANECPAVSVDALYKMAERAEVNGLAEAGAVIRKNGRIYFHRGRFDQWWDR